MKRVLTSNKGASSILVVLLLVVLVVFGIAALTTALSNLRLGQKSADWNSVYYGAEAQAQACFAKIDKAVHDAFDSNETNIDDAVCSSLKELDLSASTDIKGGTMMISFDTWNGDIGIYVTLAMDLTDKNSLRAIKWQEKQRHS